MLSGGEARSAEQQRANRPPRAIAHGHGWTEPTPGGARRCRQRTEIQAAALLRLTS